MAALGGSGPGESTVSVIPYALLQELVAILGHEGETVSMVVIVNPLAVR